MTRPGERPVLITDVGDSPQDEYNRRRRRYSTMMAGRVLCIIAAFVVGSIYHNIWLSLLCIAGAAVLPWAAVLIANDRLPKAERLRMAEARKTANGATVTATALPRTASDPRFDPRFDATPGAHGDVPTDDRPPVAPRVIEG